MPERDDPLKFMQIIDIDWDAIALLAMAQVSEAEIRRITGHHQDTLEMRCPVENDGEPYSDWLETKRMDGRARVMMTAWNKAINGHARALKDWQDRYLGPVKKRTEIEHTGGVEVNVEVYAIPCNGRDLIHAAGECAQCDIERQQRAVLEDQPAETDAVPIAIEDRTGNAH